MTRARVREEQTHREKSKNARKQLNLKKKLYPKGNSAVMQQKIIIENAAVSLPIKWFAVYCLAIACGILNIYA